MDDPFVPSNDPSYLRWVETHPDGFVVNTGRAVPQTYIVLHRATCHSIRKAAAARQDQPFTGGQYIKVCSTSILKLRRWVRDNSEADGFSKRCGICHPPTDSEP